ncbi:MAG: metal-sensitive transcriptional regulator [Desulfotignum sp.]|nr:metal-sensitive transcriptional regulator [Desulfotignum sp.]MCF8138554.1 metal-sensitive transcriptional regulator [Desulfotignum sp.]
MHPEYNDQLPSLNRIEGQIKGIKKMIENRRYCVDILIQLKAVKAALHKVEQDVLKTHMQHCLMHAVTSKDQTDIQEKIDELMQLLSKRI